MDKVETGPLPYLLSPPSGTPDSVRPPILCFLHGYDEAAPRPMEAALTRHGPLHPANAALAAPFLVVAPQLPTAGDLWHRYGREVSAIITEAQAVHGGDPSRTYLTGFSFGGNGVFDLALADQGLWTALWAVDPTRVPLADPGLPVWLSLGEVSRHARAAFAGALGLRPADEQAEGPRLWRDQGADHVGTARLAYGDGRIYQWLLRHAR